MRPDGSGARKRRGRKPHDPVATRAALVAAATRLFAERGFDGARVDHIAQAAGVNKAMISYHFGGKRGLYEAILREGLSALADQVRPLRAARQAPDQALRELIATLGRALARGPELPAIMLREILEGGRRLDAQLMAHVLAVFATTRELIERGVRRGRFRRVDPALTHLGVVGSLIFFFATAPFRTRKVASGQVPAELRSTLDPAGFIAHMQELTARGLTARRPAAPARR